MDCKWSPQGACHDPFIIYNFTRLNISVINSAKFEISLKSKDPVHHLTADGHNNVGLFRDTSMQLYIKIDGGIDPFFTAGKLQI
uniref:Uncharacterized protein n=1 Tax=Tetranychus urticae TaxID=32264 RepID=T1JTZ3_TETUR